MGIKRRILASAAVALGITQIYAASTRLTVELKAGDKYSFLLADKPVITFSSGDLVVNGEAETAYSIEGVKNFHFTEGEASSSSNLAKDAIRIISLDNTTIKVENIESQSIVTLVNVSGALISLTKADSEGTATVSLSQAKGVYILTAAGKSFKIIKK
ncbi:MAG: T9SS type A sorting domain-containing protein [Paludibacteraceae bacterium]|nr:T9SS type A sorting domain-containing protein [Paludibacteraceae bacterium]MEE1260345.1 T9SS type A sorting domain-containing protein [Paludibacteraceae bacterium]